MSTFRHKDQHASGLLSHDFGKNACNIVGSIISRLRVSCEIQSMPLSPSMVCNGGVGARSWGGNCPPDCGSELGIAAGDHSALDCFDDSARTIARFRFLGLGGFSGPHPHSKVSLVISVGSRARFDNTHLALASSAATAYRSLLIALDSASSAGQASVTASLDLIVLVPRCCSHASSVVDLSRRRSNASEVPRHPAGRASLRTFASV